jgi:hypothetical protein
LTFAGVGGSTAAGLSGDPPGAAEWRPATRIKPS